MTMLSYAFYRLPYSYSYTLIETDKEPLLLNNLDGLENESGFLIAPFMDDDAHPLILIRPDKISRVNLSVNQDATMKCDTSTEQYESVPDESYETVFGRFHDAVQKGRFKKLVLARTKVASFDKCDLLPLFERACHLYPRLMIMMFSTPMSGTWIMASPEILVEGKGKAFHTIALAGTMKWHEGFMEWDSKNRDEQAVVAKYIEYSISPLSKDVVKDGPVSMRAGDLAHLRTDFRFHLNEDVGTGALLSSLHPTPAVCGFPRQEAKMFINDNEGMQRSYYCGFAGPVGMDDETHLYVSLRCARLEDIRDGKYVWRLFAGGGIMPDSDCLSEWKETEMKFKTIENVLQ